MPPLQLDQERKDLAGQLKNQTQRRRFWHGLQDVNQNLHGAQSMNRISLEDTQTNRMDGERQRENDRAQGGSTGTIFADHVFIEPLRMKCIGGLGLPLSKNS